MDANKASRLREAISGLPDVALVPVSWIREQLAADDVAAGQSADARLVDLTCEAVAHELGRRAGTVRAWIASGALQGYRLRGREWRVTRVALRAFLDAQSQPPPPGGPVRLDGWRRHFGDAT